MIDIIEWLRKIERSANKVYLQAGLAENSLSKEELITKIAKVEVSEYNEIFLYVVTFLKEKLDKFE
ncbi:MAG: hypothetical protein MRK01_01605 [Candidatus Scalindua sp.]|nr:hypothetical protein [Candidatus Scalindua sp.]